MTHLHHHTAVDIACERIVRPVTDDFMSGHRDGLRGWSMDNLGTQFYRRGYWKGLYSREYKWLATFGQGPADCPMSPRVLTTRARRRRRRDRSQPPTHRQRRAGSGQPDPLARHLLRVGGR